MNTNITVCIVDDDDSSISSLEFLLKSVQYSVISYNSPTQFLSEYNDKSIACLISDIRMPGMTGLELQEKLKQQGNLIPIVFITGHADVPIAVRAMKQGAVDFIEKPIDSQRLLEGIHQCIQKQATLKTKDEVNSQTTGHIRQLTPREKEVMDLIIEGLPTKRIAARLNISISTAESHRSRVMKKMEAESVTHLVKLILANYTET